MLGAYQNNGDWKAKDAALYLILAVLVKSQTKALGASRISELIDTNEFFISHILPELQNEDYNTVCHFI